MAQPQPLSARELTFEEAVAELVSVASQHAEGSPRWQRVEVFESRVGPGDDPAFTPAGPADDYEDRWREVLDRVDRGWVNLRLLPVTDGALGVLVEYVGAATPRRRERIALVLGGELTEA